jgi:hypothetical protein
MRKNRLIDLISKHFWKNGYTLLGRKASRYLPDPPKIGIYEVDAIGRNKKEYLIGLCLDERELSDLNILEKIRFLSSRRTRFSQRSVVLLLGVPERIYRCIKDLVDSLEEINKKNIQIIRLREEAELDLFDASNSGANYSTMSLAS